MSGTPMDTFMNMMDWTTLYGKLFTVKHQHAGNTDGQGKFKSFILNMQQFSLFNKNLPKLS